MSRGERTDLLLDNMPGVEDPAAAHRIIDTLDIQARADTLDQYMARYRQRSRPPARRLRHDAEWARARQYDDLNGTTTEVLQHVSFSS